MKFNVSSKIPVKLTATVHTRVLNGGSDLVYKVFESIDRTKIAKFV